MGEEHFEVVGQVGHQHEPARDGATARATRDTRQSHAGHNALVQVDTIALKLVSARRNWLSAEAPSLYGSAGGADFSQRRHERGLGEAACNIPAPCEHRLHAAAEGPQPGRNRRRSQQKFCAIFGWGVEEKENNRCLGLQTVQSVRG